MKGGVRSAFRLALEIIDKGYVQGDVVKQERGWKLFFLIPRLLLYKTQGETIIPKEELSRRCVAFTKGEWQDLLEKSDQCVSSGQNGKPSAEEARLIRAEALVGLGELSPARQALESSDLAPGNDATLAKLSDPDRRPPVSLDVLPDSIRQFVPTELFPLDPERFAKNLRGARKGAAPGPSGMTANHLRVLLDDDNTLRLLF